MLLHPQVFRVLARRYTPVRSRCNTIARSACSDAREDPSMSRKIDNRLSVLQLTNKSKGLANPLSNHRGFLKMPGPPSTSQTNRGRADEQARIQYTTPLQCFNVAIHDVCGEYILRLRWRPTLSVTVFCTVVSSCSTEGGMGVGNGDFCNCRPCTAPVRTPLKTIPASAVTKL